MCLVLILGSLVIRR